MVLRYIFIITKVLSAPTNQCPVSTSMYMYLFAFGIPGFSLFFFFLLKGAEIIYRHAPAGTTTDAREDSAFNFNDSL